VVWSCQDVMEGGDDLVKRCMYCIELEVDGKRPRGRPKRTWGMLMSLVDGKKATK
jgi:hypothetical protein